MGVEHLSRTPARITRSTEVVRDDWMPHYIEPHSSDLSLPQQQGKILTYLSSSTDQLGKLHVQLHFPVGRDKHKGVFTEVIHVDAPRTKTAELALVEELFSEYKRKPAEVDSFLDKHSEFASYDQWSKEDKDKMNKLQAQLKDLRSYFEPLKK